MRKRDREREREIGREIEIAREKEKLHGVKSLEAERFSLCLLSVFFELIASGLMNPFSQKMH